MRFETGAFAENLLCLDKDLKRNIIIKKVLKFLAKS